jgi:hypothetical protein
MDSTVIAMTLAGAVLAFALINNFRSHATRRREAEFFGRRLRAGRPKEGQLRLLTGPR